MAKRTYIRSGNAWVDITTGAGIPRYASAPASPAPSANQVYYNTTDGLIYIYDGTAWDPISSIERRGSAPASPSPNQAYYNTTDSHSYVWNGTTWDKLIGAATATSSGAVLLQSTTPAAIAASASTGTGTTVARADHVHANQQDLSTTATPSLGKLTLSAVSANKDHVTISDTTVGAGLTIGADTNLYRAAANFLKTDDVLEGLNSFADYATTATAAGTTTLTSASTGQQYFTGTSTQTIVLPVTSTLQLGWQYRIVNLSTGALTVNSSGGNLVGTIPANGRAVVTCILTSGTTAASWDFDPIGASGMRLVSTTTLAASTQTWTVSGIPATYKSLIIYAYNIKSSTATAANLVVQINGLSTTTYGRKGITATSASTTVGTSAATSGDTSWAVDLASGGVVISGAGAGSALKIEFPNYAANMYKAATWNFTFGTAASSMAPGYQLGWGYNSTTAAISSVSLVSSSATNLIGAGAVLEVYGVF